MALLCVLAGTLTACAGLFLHSSSLSIWLGLIAAAELGLSLLLCGGFEALLPAPVATARDDGAHAALPLQQSHDRRGPEIAAAQRQWRAAAEAHRRMRQARSPTC